MNITPADRDALNELLGFFGDCKDLTEDHVNAMLIVLAKHRQRLRDQLAAANEHVAALTKERDGLREALTQIQGHYQFTISHYEANGPQWTSRESGSEYYDAAWVIDNARDWLLVVNNALATPSAEVGE